MSNTQQKFYAVRVVIRYENGSTAQRDYVRGQRREGRAAFASFALGDMLRMVVGDSTTEPVTWDLFEVDFETVRQNRLYHHTTH